jgi:periplasmic mercuric ion binding protein
MNTIARKIAWFALASALVTGVALTVTPGAPALAAAKTVTLDVPGMSCAACPITVKTALTKVEGVGKAEVSFDKKEAVVTYDDAKTTVEALMEATKKAGYPSTEKR